MKAVNHNYVNLVYFFQDELRELEDRKGESKEILSDAHRAKLRKTGIIIRDYGYHGGYDLSEKAKTVLEMIENE